MKREELIAEAIEKGAERFYYEDTDDALVSEKEIEASLEYFKEHIAEKDREVNSALSETENPEAFVFFADAHARQNRFSSVHILRFILENTPVKTVLYGGDTISAYADEERLYEDIEYFNKLYKFADIYPARGNHDIYAKPYEFSDVGYTFPNEKVYEYIFKDIQDKVHGIEGKTYYWFENESTKVRYIVIDTNEILLTGFHDSGVWDLKGISITNEQLSWFADVLLRTPKDYKIIVMGHIPVNENLAWPNPLCQVFGDMIEAYNSRIKATCESKDENEHIVTEVDFREAESQVVLYLCGHGHRDDLYVSKTGCAYYEIHTDSMCDNGGSPYRKIKGTAEECAVDVIIYDRDNGSIRTVRYGAGVNRVLRESD